MARSDRLLRLLQTLRRLPPPVTAARLARETEVSERTLYRDIDALRRAGAGIDGAAGFGYTLTEDPGLPPQTFSRIEIEALMMGLGEVVYRGDPELAAAADMALSKIIASLGERQQRQAAHAVVRVHRYVRPPAVSVDLGRLRRACWEEEALDLRYRDESGAETVRRIWPLAIAYLQEATIVLAWCCLRRDFRKFRIERIVDAAVTGDFFRPRRVALLRDYMALLRGTPS